jgi:hypothetical protein
MTSPSFVPADFDPPTHLATDDFVLEPLGPRHNVSDHAAWTSSIDHIRATPGYPDGSWPPVGGMSLVQSWVRADRAELDEPLADAVAGWLEADWPWERPDRHGR